MTSQVLFTIDKKTKEQAMKKARNEGIPLATILRMALWAYVKGHLTLGFLEEQPFNLKTRQQLDSAIKDIEVGKNITRFRNADEAISFLRELPKKRK